MCDVWKVNCCTAAKHLHCRVSGSQKENNTFLKVILFGQLSTPGCEKPNTDIWRLFDVVADKNLRASSFYVKFFFLFIQFCCLLEFV
jgi:hypothetical protein